MEPVVVATLTIGVILIALVAAAIVSSFRRSPLEWRKLNESDRRFKEQNPDGAKFEPTEHFLDEALDFVPPVLVPVTLDENGEVEKFTLEHREKP